MFRGNTVDGSTAFVPGDDYGEEQEGAEDAWPEEADEDNVPTPRSSSSQKKQEVPWQSYKHLWQSSEEEQKPNGSVCQGHSQYIQGSRASQQ